MPTMVSIQHNKEMKLFYDRLVEKGKPKMLAQIAVMRKLILLAHSLYKKNQKYDENRYLKFTQIKEVNSDFLIDFKGGNSTTPVWECLLEHK